MHAGDRMLSQIGGTRVECDPDWPIALSRFTMARHTFLFIDRSARGNRGGIRRDRIDRAALFDRRLRKNDGAGQHEREGWRQLDCHQRPARELKAVKRKHVGERSEK